MRTAGGLGSVGKRGVARAAGGGAEGAGGSALCAEAVSDALQTHLPGW